MRAPSPSPIDHSRERTHLPTPLTFAVLAVVALALWAIRLSGQPNLLDNEYRLGACVLDAIHAGNWICPRDSLGNTDKPPMLTWLSAAVSLPFGRVTPVTLYLPTALATVLISWLIFAAGHEHFGWRAGFLGALAYLLSDVATKQIATARWDGLFALTVMLGSLAAFHAWVAGLSWVWFWLAAAAATLTKGPLGVLLAGLGLCAVPWERRSGTPQPIRGPQLAGIGVYLLITLGWFGLAYHHVGHHLIDNIIHEELVGHMVENWPGYRFTKPFRSWFGSFAPWSIATLAGLVRIWMAPAADARVRRFERFVFCWFVGGLLVFSLSPHTATRLLFPLVPASALIAGRELATLGRRLSGRQLGISCAAITLVALAAAAVFYRGAFARKNPDVRRTLAIEELVDRVQRSVGEDFPLTYVDAPFSFQLLQNTMRPAVSADRAARLLEGDAAAFVVVERVRPLRAALGPNWGSVTEVASSMVDGQPYLRIIANRPRLERVDPIATYVGAVLVQMVDVDLASAWGDELAFRRRGAAAAVTLVNEGTSATSLRVRFVDRPPLPPVERTLEAGETWRLEVP
jgi:hypothetical protein